MPPTKPTAIVVDDNEDIVSVLTEFLQIKGINVIGKGYDGKEAVELYKNLRPDIVFLDVMMEKYDGFYALEKIKEVNHDAFVVAVTADLTLKTHSRLVHLNISEIIYKPFDVSDIVRTLESYLQG